MYSYFSFGTKQSVLSVPFQFCLKSKNRIFYIAEIIISVIFTKMYRLEKYNNFFLAKNLLLRIMCCYFVMYTSCEAVALYPRKSHTHSFTDLLSHSQSSRQFYLSFILGIQGVSMKMPEFSCILRIAVTCKPCNGYISRFFLLKTEIHQ